MKKIGMGLVGSGFLADKFAACYREDPRVKLVAVASKTPAHAKSLAEKYGLEAWYTDYEKMFERDDIDAVNVCVPNYLHHRVTISAAEHKKHVLCTKPLAVSTDQAEKMVRACRRAGVKLMYGENWLFTPAAERMREIIREGALGRLLVIEAREQHSGSHSPYATRREYCGGGVLIHMAVHPIGFIMHMMRRPVRRVYAELGNLLHRIEVEDYAVVLMRFEGGGAGIAHSNYITKGGMQDRIEIYGTEGMAFINLTHANPITIYSDVGYSYVVEKASMSRGWTSPIIDENYQYGFRNMLRHFVTSIQKDEEPISNGEFGRDVLRVVSAGYESNRKKIAVAV
ncbi:MAG: oxidoreductase [Candidatus Bathyarchaeota archaeon B63]|nr:MAG: oxidoreductase [Candidatus Bathyarchaeota archaeon B63]